MAKIRNVCEKNLSVVNANETVLSKAKIAKRLFDWDEIRK